jgi:hypothetical protein
VPAGRGQRPRCLLDAELPPSPTPPHRSTTGFALQSGRGRSPPPRDHRCAAPTVRPARWTLAMSPLHQVVCQPPVDLPFFLSVQVKQAAGHMNFTEIFPSVGVSSNDTPTLNRWRLGAPPRCRPR